MSRSISHPDRRRRPRDHDPPILRWGRLPAFDGKSAELAPDRRERLSWASAVRARIRRRACDPCAAGGTLTVSHGDTGASSREALGRRRRRHRQRPEDADELLTAGTARHARGNLGDFLDWWVVLRSLIDGRAIHTAGASISSSAGRPRSAPLGSRRPGRHRPLHRRGRFRASPQDGSTRRDAAPSPPTWTPLPTYAQTATAARGGRRHAMALSIASSACSTSTELSPANNTAVDERLQHSAIFTSDGYVPTNRVGTRSKALVKPIGVEGISDVPWHKDCSLGEPLLQLLQSDGRHLGHRRRRPVRTAARPSPVHIARAAGVRAS